MDILHVTHMSEIQSPLLYVTRINGCTIVPFKPLRVENSSELTLFLLECIQFHPSALCIEITDRIAGRTCQHRMLKQITCGFKVM